MKKELEKPIEKKTGHDEGEESPYTIEPDGPRKEDIKQSKNASKENVNKAKRQPLTNWEPSLKKVQTTPDTNRRQGNKIIKRCHFCRKRGHLKKNCSI